MKMINNMGFDEMMDNLLCGIYYELKENNHVVIKINGKTIITMQALDFGVNYKGAEVIKFPGSLKDAD